MKTQLNEIKRMQRLAGILKENEGQDLTQAVDKVETKVEDKIEDIVANLSPDQIEKLKGDLASLNIDANSSEEEVVGKIEGQLSEAEGDNPNKKVASTLSNIGTGLMGSLLVPIIPVAIGATGLGVATGFVITAATAGILISLAKVLGAEKK